MEKFSDLQEKEVINICDGRRLGFVGDLELDIPSGKIRTLIIPVEGCRWNPFGRGRAYYIRGAVSAVSAMISYWWKWMRTAWNGMRPPRTETALCA